ncbi:MAG: hypothetical protein ABL925_13045, partial [Methylococcales bacterium]
IICVITGFYFVRTLKVQKHQQSSLTKNSKRRADRFLYESVREELDAKINDIISCEERVLGEYSGTDLIERINLELDKEELKARSLPVGSSETITYLKVIGDWRVRLTNGLLQAITQTDEV